jgi:hypothetical protein
VNIRSLETIMENNDVSNRDLFLQLWNNIGIVYNEFSSKIYA